MKKLLALCILVILGAGPVASAKMMTQVWYFDTDEVEPTANVIDNDFGDPELRVDAGTGQGYLASVDGRDGVWSLSGELDILIPNDPVERPYKDIIITLIWAAGGADQFMPDRPLVGVSAVPMEGMEMTVANNTLDAVWTESVFTIKIWPNPPEEWIAVKGDILVDEIKVETECVPEPATLGLLGLGSLALLRYRRKS